MISISLKIIIISISIIISSSIKVIIIIVGSIIRIWQQKQKTRTWQILQKKILLLLLLEILSQQLVARARAGKSSNDGSMIMTMVTY